jgi:hypothetical protein
MRQYAHRDACVDGALDEEVGLGPAFHDFTAVRPRKTWMPGT